MTSESQTDEARVHCVGRMVVDVAAHRAAIDGVAVELNPKEFGLLDALIESGGHILTRQYLLRHVWRYDGSDIRTRTVDVHVRQLRRKLRGEAWRIETVWRVGYRWNGAAMFENCKNAHAPAPNPRIATNAAD